ncbi:MAG: hypothetical protein ACYC2R_09230 [Burkholderiales bacterium]
MLKVFTRAGALFILAAMALVAIILVSPVELYHRWQQEPIQSALAVVVVALIIGLGARRRK